MIFRQLGFIFQKTLFQSIEGRQIENITKALNEKLTKKAGTSQPFLLISISETKSLCISVMANPHRQPTIPIYLHGIGWYQRMV